MGGRYRCAFCGRPVDAAWLRKILPSYPLCPLWEHLPICPKCASKVTVGEYAEAWRREVLGDR